MIIDGSTVITGSFNSLAEETNAENVLIIKSKLPAKAYLQTGTSTEITQSDTKGANFYAMKKGKQKVDK